MANRQDVLTVFDELGIEYILDEHPAVYTVEDVEKYNAFERGFGCKNLFLRNAKGKVHYLVVMHANKPADLKKLSGLLSESRLSFASPERLKARLGLVPGEVTPLAINNDADKSVTIVLDDELKGQSLIGVHPNDNTATVWISYDNLIKYINHFGNRLIHLDL